MGNLLRSVTLPLAAITLLGGCMQGRPYTLVKYDRQSDTFHELRIFADIAGADHRAHDFPQTWRDRDRYIPAVICLYARHEAVSGRSMEGIFECAFLRNANHTYCWAAGPGKPGPEWKSPALDQVSIVPGKLFLSPQKNLCYYHRVDVPGKAVDDEIVDANERLRSTLIARIGAEWKRRHTGGHRRSWDDVQRELVGSMTPHPTPVDYGPAADPLTCLEDSSLNLLLAAAKAKTAMVSRKAGEIRFAVELTPEDCRRAKAAFYAVRQKAAKCDSFKNSDEPDALKGDLSSIHPGVSMAALASMANATIEDKHFIETLTVPALIDLTPEIVRKAKPFPDKAADYQRVISDMKTLGEPIDEKLTIEEVIREFSQPSPAINRVKSN
jgi:hypothetical protein